MSTPITPTLDGHPTTVPADSGPELDLDLVPSTALPTCSTEALCASLDKMRTDLIAAGDVDGQVLDVLTAAVAGLSAAIAISLGHTPATTTIAPCKDYWGKMRQARGWTQTQLITRLERIAAKLGRTLPDRECMQVQISRWENGKVGMSADYQRLFRLVYGSLTERAITIHTAAVNR